MNRQTMHIQGPQIHQFNNVQRNAIPRSAFRRDFTRKSTFNADYLVPVFVDEILPGDDISISMNAFCRLATPIKPIMDNLYLESFWFFVPNRLVWSNWEKFQGQQTNPGDSVAYTIPVLNKAQAPMSTTGFVAESIYDYLGLPINTTNLSNISALFTRAYNTIFNAWFRDEDLVNSSLAPTPTTDGPDDPSTYALSKRAKTKDYFTSARPWPQKGTAPTIPIGSLAPVKGLGVSGAAAAAVAGTGPYHDSTTNTFTDPVWQSATSTIYLQATTTGVWNATTNPMKVYADLSQSTNALNLNVLRSTALYQQILELDARAGTRYVESIYSRFGVISPDFRLQRPELIGQGSTRINIYAVPQTAPTAAGTTPQGNLAAFGTGVIGGNHSARYSATEHGIILGLVNVRADITYQEGVPRMFTRQTRLDFYEPLLNGLGEQAILNNEIYAQGTSADTDVFGYQERWSEYRYKMSEITGKFRSNASATLDVWHLSQNFTTLPTLGFQFVQSAAPISRVVAVNTEPQFLFDASFSYNHVRPMPIRSNPGIDIL